MPVKATVQVLLDSGRLFPVTGESGKAIFGALSTLAGGIAELRNVHGTGHGRARGDDRIGARQARLAVGAAATIVFIWPPAAWKTRMLGYRPRAFCNCRGHLGICR